MLRSAFYKLGAASCIASTSLFIGTALAEDVDVDLSGHLLAAPAYAESDIGVAADGWEFMGEAEMRVVGSLLLDNGIEIGVETNGKVEEDAPRVLPPGTGPFGRALDTKCSISPAAAAMGFNCFVVDPDEDDLIEDAFVFIDSGIFGRLQFGRQNGVGKVYSFGAPNLFLGNGVSDWEADISGFNLINTKNTINNGFDDFALKVTYATPRILGAQIAASYAPDTDFCGAILCPSSEGRLYPNYNNVIEVGANYYHTFRNGMTVGVSGTYLTANADGTPAVLAVIDNYQSWNLGANVGFSGFTVGASYKKSNLGRDDVDYDAYDVGATYETGAWGFMVSYGADMNQLTGQDTRAIQGGIDYSFTDKLPLGADFQIGAGVQYVEGDGILSLTPSAPGALSSTRDDESMAVFLETLVSF